MNDDTISREQLIADLGFLNETAMEFLRRSPDQDLYQYLADRLAYITGGAYVSIATFHPECESTRLRALSGPKGLRTRVLHMLGEKPMGRYRKISAEAKSQLLTGRLHKVPGGLYEVLFKCVPQAVTHAIEQLASINEIYSMGCVAQDQLLGSVLILLRESQHLPRPQVIEAFINQAAVALQRNQAEERLRTAELEFRLLMDQAVDLFIVLDQNLIITDINRRGCEELGYMRERLLGKKVMAVLDLDELEKKPMHWDLLRSGRRFAVQRKFLQADGSSRLYHARVNPLPDGRSLVLANAVNDLEVPNI